MSSNNLVGTGLPISEMPLAGYKGSILLAGVDNTLPPGSQNVAVPMFSIVSALNAGTIGTIGIITASDIDMALGYTPVNPDTLGTMSYEASGSVNISGGTINGTLIGLSVPASGAFTELTASGAVSGEGFVNLLYPYALLESPDFMGTPTAPTASAGTNTNQIATTAFVANLVASASASATVYATGVTSFDGRYGAITLEASDVNMALGYMPVNPDMLGTMASQSASAVNITGGMMNDTAIGELTPSSGSFTTLSASGTISGEGFVNLLYPYAKLDSPDFTGTPEAPTASAGSEDLQIANTEFVSVAISDLHLGTMSTQAASGVNITGGMINGTAIGNIMPASGAFTELTASDTVSGEGFVNLLEPYALLMSPDFMGTPTAPTASAGSNDLQIASTEFVTTLVAAASAMGVTSFDGRTGAVTLEASDVDMALGYTPVNPEMLSTMAYEASGSVNISGGYINGTVIGDVMPASGSFTALIATESVSGEGFVNLLYPYALLDSPDFTGAPLAPTASAGSNDLQIANTEFVYTLVAAASAMGVTSFDGRTGAITLEATDVDMALGYTPVNPAMLGTMSYEASGSVNISGGEINGTTIGLSVPDSGAFTELSATGTVSGIGFTNLLEPYAMLNSPDFTGTPLAPTASAGSDDLQIANTEFVATLVASASASVLDSLSTMAHEASGAVNISGGYINGTVIGNDVPAAGYFTELSASGTVSGEGFVNLLYPYAMLESPDFTGTPTAPTASAGSNDLQIANTEFVYTLVAASSGGGGGGTTTAIPYDLAGGFAGLGLENQITMQFVSPRYLLFPAGLSGSYGYAGTAATLTTTYTLMSSTGGTLATMTFDAGSHTATFMMTLATTISPGDVVTMTGPATPDATLANMSFTLAATITT